jgi:hypothetical protein
MNNNKKEVYFICRYTSKLHNEKYDIPVNFSVNRKVEGILTCFRNLNFNTNILVTSADIQTKNIPFLRHTENFNKIHTLKRFSFFKCRYISFFFQIISNSFYLRKIKKNIDYIIVWDLLPDTLLPIIFSSISKTKVILDIEEKITNDPEASLMFKLFENIFFKLYKSKYYFVSNESISVPSNNSLTFNGFFATSLEEELLVLEKLELKFNKPYQNNNYITLFFGGRFDKNRGIDLLIDLINLNKGNSKIKFVICGFGSDFYFDILSTMALENSNIKLCYQTSRGTFIDELINSDVSLNLLSDLDFVNNSFPSKLVELLICSNCIISTTKYDFNENLNFKLVNYNLDSINDSLHFIFNQRVAIYDAARNNFKNQKFFEKYSYKSQTNNLYQFLA